MLAATPATERASRSGDNSVARTGGPLLTAPRCVRLRLQVCLAPHHSPITTQESPLFQSPTQAI